MEDAYCDQDYLESYSVISTTVRNAGSAQAAVITETRKNFLDEVFFFRMMGRLPEPEGMAWGGRVAYANRGGSSGGRGGGRGGGGRGGGRGGGGKRACFNCGDEAHMSWECPQPKKERTQGE